mgnify:CR=1 FL=1
MSNYFDALLQASGAAVIYLASDLEDPPELIPRFIEAWERGACVVAGGFTLLPDRFLGHTVWSALGLI